MPSFWGIGPGQLARAMGLEMRRASSMTRPAFFGVLLTDRSRAALAMSTGLPGTVLDAMHLSRYDGTLLDMSAVTQESEVSPRTVWSTQWVQLYASRCCPRCLAENTVWPLWWRLESAAVCPRHRCLLLDICPSCNIRFRRGNQQIPRGLLTNHGVLDPRLCGNRARGAGGPQSVLCQHPVAELPVTGLTDDTVLAVQELMLSAANNQPMTLLGQTVSSAEWFSGVKYLIAMARFTVTDAEVDSLPAATISSMVDYQHRRVTLGRLGPKLQNGPETAAEAAALYSLVGPIVLAPDVGTAHERLGPWVHRVAQYRSRSRNRDPFLHVDRPASVDAAVRSLTPHANRVIGPARSLPQITGITPLRRPGPRADGRSCFQPRR
ncbi:TniQ family protein [Kitasatospora sp. NPDC006786]|uniref:TniQ family protein n=1 Tax=unclassified Kitasatospora TaxID=2633591 RepID=UPI0033CA9DB5